MKIAVQMDPIEKINIATDTTFALMLEAQARGHELFYYTPRDLSLQGNVLTARAFPVTIRYKKGDHATLGPALTLDLAEMDVILMRQDPPFDMEYITATYLLEHLRGRVRIINDPAGVRDTPEKLVIHHFSDLAPPTLVSADPQVIAAFRAAQGDVILKPVFDGAGRGIYLLKSGAPVPSTAGTVIVQKFLPEISEGDKRIILIDGEPAGAVLRVPASGEVRANFAVGGTGRVADITESDRRICARLAPWLREKGLFLVGIDVIGSYLTEVNVTSPTGFRQINALSGLCLESRFWDVLESGIVS